MESKCKGLADIGFIVDSSGSLFTEYVKEKAFLKDMAKEFKISKTGFHAGVVIFSQVAQLRIKFSDFVSTSSYIDAVDNLPLLGGTTRIDRGLNTAFKDLFSSANGMRPAVPKVAILLTDGEQTQDSDSVSPYDAVQAFHAANIKVIVIGVGSKVNKEELSRIVKSKKDLYFARDFDQLMSKAFVENITLASCLEPGEFQVLSASLTSRNAIYDATLIP